MLGRPCKIGEFPMKKFGFHDFHCKNKMYQGYLSPKKKSCGEMFSVYQVCGALMLRNKQNDYFFITKNVKRIFFAENQIFTFTNLLQPILFAQNCNLICPCKNKKQGQFPGKKIVVPTLILSIFM